MKHFVTVLLFTLTLAACQGQPAPGAAESPCIPQTVEVTRLVQPLTAIPQPGTATPTAEPTSPALPVSVQAISASVQMDAAYFDGFVVLTKYFTLLGHGLYEESYQILSASQQKRYDFEGYSSFYADSYNSLEVDDIKPYNYWLAQQGLPPQPIPENEIRYIIGMTAFHKGAAWNVGGTPTPYSSTGFVSLVLENGKWKINEHNSAPW